MQQFAFFKIARQCPICSVECNSKCSGCNAVYYCCKQHQTEHWPLHKVQCKILQKGTKVNMTPEPEVVSAHEVPNEKQIANKARKYLMDFVYHYINQCEEGVRNFSARHERCFISIEMKSGEGGPVYELPYVGNVTIETDTSAAEFARKKDLRKFVREYDIKRETVVVIWNRDGSFSQTWQIAQPWVLRDEAK